MMLAKLKGICRHQNRYFRVRRRSAIQTRSLVPLARLGFAEIDYLRDYILPIMTWRCLEASACAEGCGRLQSPRNKMGATYPPRIILAFRSGGMCAYPKCGKHLTYEAKFGDDTYVGEAAHIRGEKPTAARYDATMTDEERDNVRNLIYMCTDHHTIIDKVEKDWPATTLQTLKDSHESQVREAMEVAFADVAFPELERSVSWVTAQPPALTGSFDLVAPDEKIQKNALTNGARHIIAAGMTARATVSAYVEAESHLDSNFPERLKAGFLAEYYSLRKEGYTGDDLFELMCSFAQQGFRSQADRTAGLAVLIYLFEICDVFEK